MPHLVWYPGATYTLRITADTYHAKRFTIHAPSTYPRDNIVDVGELRFDEGIAISANERPVRFLEYDIENRDYYKQLFEKLTVASFTDHQIIDTICKYVATRHNPIGDPWGFKSARQILEQGAPHCSNLAFAMAAITWNDPLIGSAVRTKNKRAASYKEVRLDTGFGFHAAYRNIFRPDHHGGWMDNLYSSGFHHYYYLRW